jgi:hypothetical protein
MEWLNVEADYFADPNSLHRFDECASSTSWL